MAARLVGQSGLAEFDRLRHALTEMRVHFDELLAPPEADDLITRFPASRSLRERPSMLRRPLLLKTQAV
jgi:hypothetical protein